MDSLPGVLLHLADAWRRREERNVRLVHSPLLVPDTNGVLKDHRAFFRQGRSGAGRVLLDSEELSRYHRRVADLAPPDLPAWLHRR